MPGFYQVRVDLSFQLESPPLRVSRLLQEGDREPVGHQDAFFLQVRLDLHQVVLGVNLEHLS